MKIRVVASLAPASATVVFVPEGGALVGPAAQAVDQAAGGVVSAMATSGFAGKVAEVAVAYAGGESLRRYVLAGIGQREKLNAEALRCAAGKAATTLRELGVTAFTIALPSPEELGFAGGAEALAQAVTEGALLSLYQFNEYRSAEADELRVIDEITLALPAGAAPAPTEAGVATARVLAEAIGLCRTLILHPGDVVTPQRLADEARTAGEAAGCRVDVLDEKALAAKGLNALLAVGQGSVLPPRLIVMEWQGAKPGEAPVAIVGKGVTFDTGGIGIKPGPGMERMKYDMGGGAAAIAIVVAAARLKLPLNVVGIVAACENMPSGTATRPGDIVTSYQGLTIEINDTDAEGRVVLADALAYAVKDCGARAIVDMATLTGSVGVALGRAIAGIMGNDQAMIDRLVAIGEEVGDRCWQLPIDDSYGEPMRSELADLKNYGGRWGDAVNAAWFLRNFVGETPWVHLDIAGAGWTDKDLPYRPKGPTGAPVRQVVKWLAGLADA